MATKSYKWFFDLAENLLTKDVTNDYTATVKTLLPKTIDNLADDIVKETAYNRETVIGVITLYDKKIIESVCLGNTVNTGSTLYAPALPGSFIGTEGVVDPAKQKPYVNINPSAAFRKELESVVPVFSGNVLDSGGARIGLVTDSATGRTDGFMTPGNTIDITGKKIRSLNADGSGIGSIKFVNAETEAVAATVTSLTINDPGRIILVVPTSLTDGTYRLEIETYFSNNSTLLKSPRTLMYAPLYIGKVPSSGGDGEDERPGEL